MPDTHKYSPVTALILKAYYTVYNKLGYGLLEKVYENAILIELIKWRLDCTAQFPVKVFYNDIKVGFYIADIIVNDCVIIEIKAAEALREEHEAQLINYLRATDLEVGMLLNFGKKPQFKRKVFSKEFK